MLPAIGFVAFAFIHAQNEENVVPWVQSIGALAILFLGSNTHIEHPSFAIVITDIAIFVFGGWLAYRSILGGGWPTRVIATLTFLVYAAGVLFVTLNLLDIIR